MTVRSVATILIFLLWLAADAALLRVVVLDWWIEAQYIATSPGFVRRIQPPPVLARVSVLANR